MFKKIIIFTVLVLSSLFFLSCGESNIPTDNNTNADESPTNYEDGFNLMGFADSRSLVYLKVDTVTSLDSTYSIDVTNSFITFSFSGNGEDWIIKKDGKPYNNLKISEFSILLNGCWETINETEVINYFSVPPMIMPREIIKDSIWSGYFPSFEETDSTFLFYNAYYGFYFKKQFVGIERIIIPAGEFDAYRFDVDLFDSEFSDSPVIRIQEYYVPSLGMVKHQLTGGPLKQSMSLIDTASIIE